jgi:hypothetical protein
MKCDHARESWRRVRATLIGSAIAGFVLVAIPGGAGAVTAPDLKITAGPYHTGERINLSVGPNHFFTPYSRVNVLECADAGGKKNNLPINVSSCDGNTIQGNSILVQSDGSFSERGYQLFAVPDASFGEGSDTSPVCNQKKMCVLYIGQNQESFTAPKMFSQAFTVSKSSKH